MLRPVDVIVLFLGFGLGLWVFGLISVLRRYFRANRAANGVPRAGIPRRPRLAAVPIEHAPYGDGGLDDSYDKPYFVDTVPVDPRHAPPALQLVAGDRVALDR